MTHIASTVADLIGGIPLVRISHVTGDDVDTVVRVEVFSPASFMEDRITCSIIDAAEASGALVPGGTIIEATSGNTGIALPMVDAACGYKVVTVMSISVFVERRATVHAFGAGLVLTGPKGGVSVAAAKVEHIVSEHPDAITASQFTNSANPIAYVTHTGEEIWADTNGQVDVSVAGVGTDGTTSGAAKVLEEENPNARIIAAQPTGSPLLTDSAPGPYNIQGFILDFVPETFDADIMDEVISVETVHVLELARHAAAEEGLLVGISSDAVLAGAAAVAARPGLAGRKIVTLLSDTSERYPSTVLSADFGNQSFQPDALGWPWMEYPRLPVRFRLGRLPRRNS